MVPQYRRCVSCRKVDHKSAFWRVVRVFPSQQVQLDQGMGRSAYLCPNQGCLQLAQKKDKIGRSLKATIPGDLYQALWQRLASHPSAQVTDFSTAVEASTQQPLIVETRS